MSGCSDARISNRGSLSRGFLSREGLATGWRGCPRERCTSGRVPRGECAKLSWDLNGSAACGVMMLCCTSTATEGGAVYGQCATFEAIEAGKARRLGEVGTVDRASYQGLGPDTRVEPDPGADSAGSDEVQELLDEEVRSLAGKRYARGGVCGGTAMGAPRARCAWAVSGCRGYEAKQARSRCVPMRRCRARGGGEVLLRQGAIRDLLPQR